MYKRSEVIAESTDYLLRSNRFQTVLRKCSCRLGPTIIRPIPPLLTLVPNRSLVGDSICVDITNSEPLSPQSFVRKPTNKPSILPQLNRAEPQFQVNLIWTSTVLSHITTSVTMADSSQRSYLRDSCGPRVVDVGTTRGKSGSGSRHHRDSDEKGQHRSKRDSSRRTSKNEASNRKKHSISQATDVNAERPTFELEFIGQPPGGVALGMPVETSVMISLRLPSPDRTISADSIETSRLFAVASLVADNRSGDRVPLEAGIMTGQKMFDSVHSIPDECAEQLANNRPCRLVLGYFSFPDLLIRQSGTYRIRTTLIKTASSGDGGASSIINVDSETFKVERRSIATPRRHQRVYG